MQNDRAAKGKPKVNIAPRGKGIPIIFVISTKFDYCTTGIQKKIENQNLKFLNPYRKQGEKGSNRKK